MKTNNFNNTYNTSSPVEAITNLCFLESPEVTDDSLIFDSCIVCGGNEPAILDKVYQLYKQNRIKGNIIISGNQASPVLSQEDSSKYEKLLPIYNELLKKGQELGIPNSDLIAPFKQKIDLVNNTHRLRAFKDPEYIIFNDYALELGIPKSAIILEKQATNTRENIVNSIEILAATEKLNSMNNILITTKAFMTRRTEMSLKSIPNIPSHINFSYLPFTSNSDISIHKEDWQDDPRSVKRLLEELIRIGKYTLKKDLSI